MSQIDPSMAIHATMDTATQKHILAKILAVATYCFAMLVTVLSAILAMSFMVVFTAHAQTPSQQSKPANSSPSKTTTLEARPTWSQLSAVQQQALLPLLSDWAELDSVRKKKWLGVAQRYQTMSAQDQQRMHARMQAWAKLSPAQRQEARDNYSKAISSPSSAPVDGSNKANLNEQWAKYQALPAERRAAIQAEADKNAKPAIPSKSEKTKPLAKP